MRADALAAADGRVHHVVLGMQLARVDAHEHQVAGRLADGLERQAGERLLRVGLALDSSFSLLFGISP